MKQQQGDKSTHISSHRHTIQERLELSIEKSQRKLSQLEHEIEERKKGLLEENRKRLSERIRGIMMMREKRKKDISESEERMKIVREIELQREAKRLQEEMKQKEIELINQQKILSQRHRLRQPMNFQQIYLHQYSYLKHLNPSTPHHPYEPRSPTNPSNNHQTLPTPPASHRQHAKSMLQKRNKYALQVQKLYHNAKISTEPSKYDVIDEEMRQQRERMYRREAKRRRKGLCPELKEDPVLAMRKEIGKVAKSGRGFREKFGIIDGLSKSYLSKYETSGKEYALELAAQANIALANLYLSEK